MINKNDFVQMQFTARVKDGEIFDTNIKEDAKKIEIELEEKPFIFCVGKDMVIKGLDKALEGKEVGKKYSIELQPEEAFGDRKKDLVRLIPMKLFTEKNISVKQGMTLALDNMLVKIISVSGGRVLADFNNPVAGKVVIYDFTIIKKVEDIEEKVNSILDYFLRQRLPFKIEDKKIVFEVEQFYEIVFKQLNDNFKDILGYEMVVGKKSQKVEEKKQEEKAN